MGIKLYIYSFLIITFLFFTSIIMVEDYQKSNSYTASADTLKSQSIPEEATRSMNMRYSVLRQTQYYVRFILDTITKEKASDSKKMQKNWQKYIDR